MNCAILFARRDSIYKDIPGCDVFDIERDATNYSGNLPVVAHTPCRSWGNFSKIAKPRPGERDLAFFAVEQVRRCGGVLEHPAASKLWREANLPCPGQRDEFGGFTLPISQSWFGHKAEKKTFLYIVGIAPGQIPVFPLDMRRPEFVVARNRRMKEWDKPRPEITKSEREHTPVDLAHWLVDLAVKCKRREIAA